MTRIPAEVFPPGDFLRDELDERGLTVADFARHTGLPESTIAGIISGEQRITAQIADALGGELGTSSDFWLNVDKTYRTWRK